MPTPRAWGGSISTWRSPKVRLPSSGRTKPARTISSVVLPEPDGPSSVTKSPAAMCSDTPSSAVTAP